MAVTTSLGLSVLYLIIFGFYAYSFYFGGVLRWSPDLFWRNDLTGNRYTGGEVMGIMFMVMFGIMQIGTIGPNIKAMTEAKIGGRLAYDVIEAKPLV